MKAIIIEDEINAYEYLAKIIKDVKPEVDVIGHLDSVEDSINWIANHGHEIDLVFVDIQLSDGLSFEIFRHVQVDAPIIFTTAYDEYALKAFELNSLDYLLKPILKEDLEKSFKKLQNFQGQHQLNSETVDNILKSYDRIKRNRFLVKKGNHFEFVNANEVSFIHSEDSLTFIYMPNGRRHLYSKTVESLERELDSDIFIQINRKQIVNINSVKKIHPFLNQRLKLDLGTNNGGLDFIVSRNKTTEFKQWVDR